MKTVSWMKRLGQSLQSLYFPSLLVKGPANLPYQRMSEGTLGIKILPPSLFHNAEEVLGTLPPPTLSLPKYRGGLAGEMQRGNG